MSTTTTRQSKNAAHGGAPPRARPWRRWWTLGLNLLAVAAGLVIWYLLARLGAFRGNLPSPGQVWQQARTSLASGQLEGDAAASLARVLAGFALGTLVAVPVGFLMGWYRVARAVIEPYIQFWRTIPPLAIIPLAVMLLGIGETPKVFVIFFAAFMASVIAAYQGVIGVDATLINAARVLGARDWVIFRRVAVPAATPFILTGMRIGLGSAWATVVAAELIAAQSGLGFRMQQAQLNYQPAVIFVNLIAIGILGLVMDHALQMAERRLTAWQEAR